jgi:hypothetical protein
MKFVKIPFNGREIEVSSDYYMENGIRMPVDVPRALEIARTHNAVLPTKEIVDTIWHAADLKLTPITLPPGPDMTKFAYFKQHNDLIEKQIGNRPFTLIAGHKKDILQPLRNGKVTIYGWHRTTGNPIQPVSNVHGAYYADYSHGLRLVRIPN